MARNAIVTLAAGGWTQLTSGNVSAIRAQNLSGYVVRLMATADTTEPTDFEGVIDLLPNQILAADMTLDQIWPGVPSAARVWAYCGNGGSVSVSHA